MIGISELIADFLDAADHDWLKEARPEQLPPEGLWSTWLILAGRGWGKTRTGAQWTTARAMSGTVSRIALVAPTSADARDVMIEGPSGILAVAPSHNRPEYEPSRRRLTWPNGCQATTFSADEPERLRGPQHGAAWCDELGAWNYVQEAWDQLMFGLRIGAHPQCLVTTTPKPIRLLRDLLAREGQRVVVTRGKTQDNVANLAPAALAELERRYGGTRLGRQELEGLLLVDVPGALWTLATIEAARVETAPDLARIVVGVDPAVSTSENSNETGIVVAGLGHDGHAYVLADVSDKCSPEQWARNAVREYHARGADRVVAEVNNGGNLVEATIRTVDQNVSYKAVHASRGKVARAEPVSALYEQGRVHHVGGFPVLEDQMTSFVATAERGRASPDRVDALVWALTELMLENTAGRGVLEFYRMEVETVERLATESTEPIRLVAPSGTSHVMTIAGRSIQVEADGTVMVTGTEAMPLERQGWPRAAGA